MKTKFWLASLFAGGVMLGLAGGAQADPIYMDLGVGGGVDGHVNPDGGVDPDQQTGAFDELAVFANTTTTQFDTDGDGVLSDGDRFSDFGHLNVTGLNPGVLDTEGLNTFAGYQMTAVWAGLTGTATALRPGAPGTLVSDIAYDKVGNATFDVYVDSQTGGITGANFGGTVGANDDVLGTFTNGVKVLSVLIVGGGGTNVFDAITGAFLRGSSTLIGEVTFALEDFWNFADGGDFNDLIESLVKIQVAIDQNTNNAIAVPGADGTLFVVHSDHDGSISFVRIPEPASVLMFGLGFLALGGLTLAGRRRQAA